MTLYATPLDDRTVTLRSVFHVCCFFACFIAAAVVTQMFSTTPPAIDGSPLDYFTGSALWILSAICLLNGMARSEAFAAMASWLCGSAFVSVLAIDEVIGLHGVVEFLLGDDDHFKLLVWATAPVVLLLAHRTLGAPRSIAWIFAAGWAVHTVFLALDAGDGDYFTLPIALETLQWAEGVCELLFVTSYLAGFMLMTSGVVRNHIAD